MVEVTRSPDIAFPTFRDGGFSTSKIVSGSSPDRQCGSTSARAPHRRLCKVFEAGRHSSTRISCVLHDCKGAGSPKGCISALLDADVEQAGGGIVARTRYLAEADAHPIHVTVAQRLADNRRYFLSLPLLPSYLAHQGARAPHLVPCNVEALPASKAQELSRDHKLKDASSSSPRQCHSSKAAILSTEWLSSSFPHPVPCMVAAGSFPSPVCSQTSLLLRCLGQPLCCKSLSQSCPIAME